MPKVGGFKKMVEMAQLIKVPGAKPDDLSSTLRTHEEKREVIPKDCPLTSTCL